MPLLARERPPRGLQGSPPEGCLMPLFHPPHRIRINKVRIQRLQDISDVDCMAEGINYYEQEGFSWCSTGDLFDTPREAYAALIDKISGKGTWESNPYVWVYEFELVKWI